MQPLRRRRIIIDDDSDSDERGGPVTQAIPTPPDVAPAEAPAVDLLTVSSDSGSSDSADPISRKARKISCRIAAQRASEANAAAQRASEANAAALFQFQYAAKHGHFPKNCPAVPRPPKQQPEESTQDDGFLWNARPPASSQYLQNEAAHGDSSTSGTSGSSEGSLDDDNFIDKDTSPTFSAADVNQLQLFFPVTSKRFCPAAQRALTKFLHQHNPNSQHRLPAPPPSSALLYPLSPIITQPSPYHPPVLSPNAQDPGSPDTTFFSHCSP